MQAAGVNTASRGKSIQKRKANESVNCQCKLQVKGRIEGETLKIFSDNLNSQEPSIYEAPSTYFIGGGNWIHWMVQLGYPMNRKEYLLGKRKIRGREIKIDMGIMDILKQGIKHLEIWKK